MFIGVPTKEGNILLRLIPKPSWWQRIIEFLRIFLATIIKWSLWAALWWLVGVMSAGCVQTSGQWNVVITSEQVSDTTKVVTIHAEFYSAGMLPIVVEPKRQNNIMLRGL